MHKRAYTSILIWDEGSFGLSSAHSLKAKDAAMIGTALAKLRAISKTSAFNEWLGARVTSASEGSAELQLAWRKILKLGNRQTFCRAEIYGDAMTNKRLLASGETILMRGA